MSDRQNELDQLSINALRFLAVDGIEKAKCGHPGAPLGCAPIAYLLYHKLMKHDPADPKWIDRDRFVLSNGHASMLLYGSLHLSGYDLPMAQLEQFRQWGSETPGHPERGDTPGVEVTTGPLGQGFGMAVGMAAAERHLAAVYNRDGHAVVDHHTYVLCGDGDLMEGVSHEAASLAGTLGLGKLIVLYDDNLISLDGPTSLSYTEDVTKRFEAYNWQVLSVADGNDLVAIEDAIKAAKADTTRPTLIRVRTVIGYGSPKAGTNKAHGEALGTEAARETKKNLGWPEDKNFYVPDEARRNWETVEAEGQEAARGVGRAVRRVQEGVSRAGGGVRARGCGQAGRGLGEVDSELPVGAGRQESGDAQRWQCGDECDREGGAGAVWRRGRHYRLRPRRTSRTRPASMWMRRGGTSTSECASSA